MGIELTEKQILAFDKWHDSETNEIVFGGSAGGGKSLLGSLLIFQAAFSYPGTRWLVGRAIHKTLMDTTFKTMMDLVSLAGWKNQLKYNGQTKIIAFNNGSEILLRDLNYYPSDPNYDELGSLEITGAFVDECNQIESRCRDVIKSRIRYKLTEYNLIPKLFMSCNPSKNWVYRDFYKPFTEGKLQSNRAFIPATVKDNPHISPHYVESLENMQDHALKQRLLFGNWDYDDDPSVLYTYDEILDLFSNSIDDSDKYYIVADIARLGTDKTVISIWRGFQIIKFIEIDKNTIDQAVDEIKRIKEQYKVPTSQILVDESGLGGGVKDYLNCKGFVGASSAKGGDKYSDKPNFNNLRSQCFYKLQEYLQKRLIRIDCNEKQKELIIEELQQIKGKDIDKDRKLAVIPKDEIKLAVGRSPDYADTISMRMWFELTDEGLYIL